jgi:hypothetical protein
MNREDHALVAIPARPKSLNIIVEHWLYGSTLYLHKRPAQKAISSAVAFRLLLSSRDAAASYVGEQLLPSMPLQPFSQFNYVIGHLIAENLLKIEVSVPHDPAG